MRIVSGITSTPAIGGPFTGRIIMKIVLVAAALVVATASPAFAKHCPKDIAIIDQSMSKATDKMKMAEVMALRNKGEAFHKAGDHAASIKALHAAVKILGVAPYKPM